MFEAKIVDARIRNDPIDGRVSECKVHYLGWRKHYDEWLPEDRLLKWTESNLKKLRHVPTGGKGAAFGVNVGNKRYAERYSHAEPSDSIGDGDTDDFYFCRSRVSLPLQQNPKDIPPFPKTLCVSLCLDQERVMHSHLLLRLPLPKGCNVSLLLASFKLQSIDGIDSDTILSFADAMLQQFEDQLPNVLYQFERLQYKQLKDAAELRMMADIYSAIYLLRLIVCLIDSLQVVKEEKSQSPKDTQLLFMLSQLAHYIDNNKAQWLQSGDDNFMQPPRQYKEWWRLQND